ncbi:hypothetical protein [Parabacteroides sp. PF5-9]|uniref:hypothetical protein n=1 Tax=Parabacteroides sp. PF5-9 TaxID=1742404 RepID=UPI002472FD54|nr:hypothetical protein [Parabacteroides sp. PF5-9]MDH6357139.1 hypothetical protein [Parabacteroides sp. PF5-9]
MAKTNSIHQESIEFISSNINAKTSEIPKCLLEYWYVPEDTDDCISISSHYFFYLAFKTYYKILGKEIEPSGFERRVLFEQFQVLIGIALGKDSGVSCIPVDLFDFDNYSKLNITVS